MLIKIPFFVIPLLSSTLAYSQQIKVHGFIQNEQAIGVPQATITINDAILKTNDEGYFEYSQAITDTVLLKVSKSGYESDTIQLLHQSTDTLLDIYLASNKEDINEVVISGTLRPVSKLESPINVEVYSAQYFKANPTPSMFDALQNVNGVRPQLNCNVCNTGDIHINGLEGPYTMILIDGMPIVSGLSTVYGLNGIPQSLIERMEVVKGPASTLYGSEAVGGLINIITKTATKSPLISVDVFGTSWGEINADLSSKIKVGKTAQTLLGINHFNYQNPIDKNKDNFTDITLQNRTSIFNKWTFNRKSNKPFSLAARYIFEDRWGGEMQWNKSYRGGDQVYGESIYTNRWEMFGLYQLPTKEHINFQFSANGHDQNSVYGNTSYIADQKVIFGQFTWFKTVKKHDILAGMTYRYTYYDDNTPATANENNIALNQPTKTHLPGLFIQDEISLNKQNKVLIGARYDYNSIHGNIITPRFNYKWNSVDKQNTIRLGIGNGYRVANVFTEDHAALTGARKVVFMNALKPETSWNANLNYNKRMILGYTVFNIDATAFYTHFNNRIIPDYDTDANKIIYDNIDGHAVSKGVSLNLDIVFPFGLKIMGGATAMDVYSVENSIKTRQLFTERFSCTWNIGYTISKLRMSIDYTGNVYSPMRLPLLSELDPRAEYSPWWSIQNIQITKKIGQQIEIYGGVKNFLNWTPNKSNPFLIARAHDPFDKNVQFDANGQAIATPENPYGLTFDPSYMYAPNQGIRFFLGFRYNLFK